ncbi:hypothetical protein [Streptomyces sp. PR69]|uniref:hypothetical protein n=1 Tax=Streptomyces sp. PR69 TaxID=2984950 RepID=UPI002B26B49C|nr:hypothetical protein [Streptomyces sp. PR69]
MIEVGGEDEKLDARLSDELDAFNIAATGADDQRGLSVRAVDEDGELIGGISG